MACDRELEIFHSSLVGSAEQTSSSSSAGAGGGQRVESQLRWSAVGSVPQAGKGGGGGAPFWKMWRRPAMTSVSSIAPLSSTSAAFRQARAGDPRKRWN